MNVMSKAVITHKADLYKASAAELAISACLLTIDDMLPYLFRRTMEQTLGKEKANELAGQIELTEDIRKDFLASFAEIMNYYAEENGASALKGMREELSRRGINAVVGFR